MEWCLFLVLFVIEWCNVRQLFNGTDARFPKPCLVFIEQEILIIFVVVSCHIIIEILSPPH